MSALALSLLYATLAGAAIPLGALVAMSPHIGPRWLETELRHGAIAFGCGILLAAVALVLVPQGTRMLTPLPAALAFASGGIVFALLDQIIQRARGHVAQLMAMLLDFVPEALAMGAMLADSNGHAAGYLLVLLIALQNLPEGFNAFCEITADRAQLRKRTFWLFVALVPLGPIAAFVGGVFLVEQPGALGTLMLFAAGGIIYLTVQDIAPQSKMRQKWLPPLGAVAGFLAGMIGQMLIV